MAKKKVESSTAQTTKESNSIFAKVLPYFAAIFAFVVITFVFFSPMITDDKIIYQGDILQFEGMAKEVIDFRKENKEEPLWTNSMFGGMPAFQISTEYKGNLLKYLNSIISFGFPEYSAYIFIACLSFFVLLLSLKVSTLLSLAGAIAYALSSYNLIILEAGHNSKMHAISLVPFVFAGAILLWQRKYLLGAAIAASGFSLLIYANHVQIAYYSFLSLFIFGIVQLIYNILKEKDWKHFFIASFILVGAGLIGVSSNLSMLWSTYEYGNSTIRGKSELTTNTQSSGGLDRDYAYKWSYGKMEAFTLMIPNFYGGSSNFELDENSAMGKIMQGAPPQQRAQYLRQMPTYWGDQPFTSGPVYLGAIICFLFLFGAFVIDGPIKWWLVAATVLSILLSFGHNLQWFSDLFFDYLPGYNKFRTVTMVLVITQLTAPLLGIYALSELLNGKIEKEKALNGLYFGSALTAGLSLVIAILGPSLFDFVGNGDKQLEGQFWDTAIGALREDRASLMRSDAFRTFFFSGIAIALVWAFIQQKVSAQILTYGILLSILIDMLGVGKRFIKDDIFVEKTQMQGRFQQTAADAQILSDNTPNFRVFNTTVNSFNDATTSYHHKSIGGYHAAKLRRYQELIEAYIQKGSMNVLNMLNTRYFIVQGQDGQPTAQFNPEASGHAWFVRSHKIVANADEEIKALDSFSLKEIAFIDKRFEKAIGQYQANIDTTSYIKLLSYKPNHLVYESSNDQRGLAIFSEIYYSPGWIATIDGKETDILRANYILRALNIPDGKHKIEFKFQPASYFIGEKVALGSSGLILVLLGFSIFSIFRKKENA
jgi:hypothetical protein